MRRERSEERAHLRERRGISEGKKKESETEKVKVEDSDGGREGKNKRVRATENYNSLSLSLSRLCGPILYSLLSLPASYFMSPNFSSVDRGSVGRSVPFFSLALSFSGKSLSFLASERERKAFFPPFPLFFQSETISQRKRKGRKNLRLEMDFFGATGTGEIEHEKSLDRVFVQCSTFQFVVIGFSKILQKVAALNFL